jgi:hypothetical protein
MLLFGGQSCAKDLQHPGLLICSAVDRALWEWDGVQWSQVGDAMGDAPPARYRHAMAYDSARKRVVLFGGATGSDPITTTVDDTWEWDGSRWTEMHPPTRPASRSGHALVYDARRGRTVLFGGQGLNSARDDVWEWDGQTWIERHPSGGPGKLRAPAMAYDSTQQVVVLFDPVVHAIDGGGLWQLVADPGEQGSCNSDVECTSGHCVDHVCCDSACGGNDTSDCQACSVAAGAMTDGTCSPIAAGHLCRASAGECDEAESCDGVHGACPDDGFKSGATVCRAATGTCDVAETCTGSSATCPADHLADDTIVCRAAAGACDVAERCDGAHANCPTDELAASGTVCAAASECLEAASCNGTGAGCPAAAPRADGSPCTGGTCQAGVCVPTAVDDLGSQPNDLAPPDVSTPPSGSTRDGCGCTIGASPRGSAADLAPALLLLAAIVWRRRLRPG